MAASKNVAPPAVATAALLVLLPLAVMLRPPTALAARHLPVTTSHQSLINLTPLRPPPPHTAVDNDEFSVLRKVPRGPGRRHRPNDPSPPPPRSAATTAKLSLLPATEQAARHLPVTTSHIALIPPSWHGRPVIGHPPPPPTSTADDDEFSVLKKVPRQPGHSPNNPSPPPPLLLVNEQKAAASSDHPALYSPPIDKDPIYVPEPPVARKQE